MSRFSARRRLRWVIWVSTVSLSPSNVARRLSSDRQIGDSDWEILRFVEGLDCDGVLTTDAMHSGEQAPYRQARRIGTAHSTDALAKRRSSMQRRRMYHQPRYARWVFSALSVDETLIKHSGFPRREQEQNRKIWSARSVDEIGEIEGHARSEECYGRSPQHDSFWSVFASSFYSVRILTIRVGQMRIDNSSLMLVRSPSSSTCCPVSTPTSSTIARLLFPTLLSIVRCHFSSCVLQC